MQLYLGSARKQHRSTLKGSKQKHEVLRFSSRRETPRSHVLNFRATSGHNVLYMRNDISKEISCFQLPSSGRRRLLLKVPIVTKENRSLATDKDCKYNDKLQGTEVHHFSCSIFSSVFRCLSATLWCESQPKYASFYLLSCKLLVFLLSRKVSFSIQVLLP